MEANVHIYRVEPSLSITWLTACSGWNRLMFGTDWPIVNLKEYIGFIQCIVPEQHWGQVFYQNAKEIYGLNL